MRASQFEIYRIVQRAREGLGAGYGADRDGARSVAWLEARGLPGLSLLAADLPVLERGIQPPGLPGGAGSELAIDMGGGSAIAHAGALWDILAGRAPAPGGGEAGLLLRHCRSPLFLIPPVLENPRGLAVCLGWQSDAGPVQARIDAQASLTLFTHPVAILESALLGEVLGDVRILAGPAGRTAPLPAGMTVALDGQSLARRFGRALDEGIEVDPEVWRRLESVAARVQVPASEESRLKGAGGGDANA
jgi:hypothetical protein